MKILKVILIALVTVFTFGSANAQVNIRIGNRHPRRRVIVVHRPYHRRVIVVHHPYHRPYYRHR